LNLETLGTYEALVIFPTQEAAGLLSEGKGAFDEFVKKHEGRILNRSELGRRPLGYVVKKSRDGYFATFDFELSPHQVQPLAHTLRLSEAVLKFTIVKKAKARSPRRPKLASKPKLASAHRAPSGERAKVR
jgi:ribosomal protein S6